MPDRQVTIQVALTGLQDASTQAQSFKDSIAGIGTAAGDASSKVAPLATTVDDVAKSLTDAASAAQTAQTGLEGVAAAGPAIAEVAAPAQEMGDALDAAGVSAQAAATGIESLGAAAPAVEQIGEAATASVPPLTDLKTASDTATAAVAKLSDITGMRGLTLGISQAKIAMDALRQSVANAQATGAPVSPDTIAKLQQLQAEINAAIQRLGTLRASMAEVGAQSMAVGEGWKQAAVSGGSMNSMMFNLALTGQSSSAALAKLGLGIIGVYEAMKVGVKTGEEFNKSVDSLRNVTGDTSALAGLAKVIGDTNIAGNDFKVWANAAAKGMSFYSQEMQPVIVNVNALMKAHQAAAAALQLDEKALKALGVAWVDPIAKANQFAETLPRLGKAIQDDVTAGAKLSDVAKDNAKELDAVRIQLDQEGKSLDTLSPKFKEAILDAEHHAGAMATWATGLSSAYKRSAADAEIYLQDTKAMFTELIKDATDSGNIVPRALQMITEAEKQAAGAQKLLTDQGAEAVVTAMAKITTARKAADNEATKEAIGAQARFEAEMRNLNQETLSSEEYSAKKKALATELADAEQIAADKQVIADAEAELAQAKLQQQMELANGVMKNVVAATDTYSTAVMNGVKPSDALAKAAGALQLAIQDTGAAVPKLDAALNLLAAQGLTTAIKAHHDLVGTMKDVEGGAALMGKAVSAVNDIFDKFGVKAGLTVAKLNDLATAMGAVSQAGA